MTKTQALKLATSKWGKNAAVRDNGVRFRDGSPRPTPEEREAFSAELTTLMKSKPVPPDLGTFGDSRTVGEYIAALKEHRAKQDAWKKRTDDLRGRVYARRFEVGEINFAFFIRGSGDTWEDALTKAGINVGGKNARVA